VDRGQGRQRCGPARSGGRRGGTFSGTLFEHPEQHVRPACHRQPIAKDGQR
jgi:hypothetical protein